MTLIKKISTGFAIGCLALGTVSGASDTAFAETFEAPVASMVSLTETEKLQIEEFFDKAGISSETQDNLMKKLEEGQMWDSVSGAPPVSSENFVENGISFNKNIYADGSVSIVTVDVAESQNESTMFRKLGGSVSQCKTVSSSHYHANQTGCYASMDFGLLQLGFNFDRSVNPGVPGRITHYYSPVKRNIGASLDNLRFDKISDQQVRLSADFAVAHKDFPVGWTLWMQVELGNGYDATVTGN